MTASRIRARRMRARRLAAIALAVIAIATLLPAGASAASPARAHAVAPSAPVDTLWAATTSGLAACADPSSSSSLATCFAAGGMALDSVPVATDGVAVYSEDQLGGAWSCPVAGAGDGCSRVMGGGWGGGATADSQVSAYAAADGSLWIGQDDGRIWRCPSDLPYEDLTSAPATCDLVLRAWKGFGGDVVNALLLANTRLYVGLQSGRILRCDDPHVGSTCMTLDDTRGPAVRTLTGGAGALWAGRQDGVIWRCDPYLQDRCATWDTAVGHIMSTAYDGAGTLYAAVYDPNGSGPGTIWSCPAATMNACTEVLADVQGNSVAAGAGGVFSSVRTALYYGTVQFTGATNTYASLLYLPATGPVGLGAVHAQVRFPEAAKRLAARCADGVPLVAQVRVTGPHGYLWKRTVDICRVRNMNMPKFRLSLLDPGTYRIRLRTEKHAARATVVVPEDTTRRIKLRLAVVR